MRQTVPTAGRTSKVNGPQGEPLDWHCIDWANTEGNVRRLRQRIFKATQEGDLRKVRKLQKLMRRSRSNTLVSVKRVTQQSKGRKTAGIDRERALPPPGELAWRSTSTSKPNPGEPGPSSGSTSRRVMESNARSASQ
ncbi:reverse transcriptase N-terminal domain-containing protein [Streptomyces sp. NBC_01020]|uniref:reverse transcriptase N-terminal domain-containing protein n=1 Tax=Streptomyces sp. NBC_01020 TaxID=2903722 RepID=UPI00386A4294